MKVTVVLDVYWQFKNATHYKVTKCRKVINCQTCKIIKQCKSGGSIGYKIAGKFYSLKSINNHIEIIPKENNLQFLI